MQYTTALQYTLYPLCYESMTANYNLLSVWFFVQSCWVFCWGGMRYGKVERLLNVSLFYMRRFTCRVVGKVISRLAKQCRNVFSYKSLNVY